MSPTHKTYNGPYLVMILKQSYNFNTSSGLTGTIQNIVHIMQQNNDQNNSSLMSLYVTIDEEAL